MSETCSASASDATNESQPVNEDGPRLRPKPPVQPQVIKGYEKMTQEELDVLHEAEAAFAAGVDLVRETEDEVTEDDIEQALADIEAADITERCEDAALLTDEQLEQVFAECSQINVGDTVVCVDATNIEELVEGRQYEVRDVDGNHIGINEGRRFYRAARFVKGVKESDLESADNE